jgi:hypothetical protein
VTTASPSTASPNVYKALTVTGKVASGIEALDGRSTLTEYVGKT